MIEIYMAKGIPEADAKTVVEVLSQHKKSWIDIMMVEELGLVEKHEHPVKSAAVTFVSFIFFGSIPVLIYLVARFVPFFAARTFLAACIITGSTLFFLGTLKIYFTRQHWYRAGLEMLLLGGLAATAAYFLGTVLGGLA